MVVNQIKVINICLLFVLKYLWWSCDRQTDSPAKRLRVHEALEMIKFVLLKPGGSGFTRQQRKNAKIFMKSLIKNVLKYFIYFWLIV